VGESIGEAARRQLSQKQPATKPAADRRLAKIRQLEAENVNLTNAVAAKAEAERLQGEVNRLQAEVDKRERRAAGKGIRMAGGGFRVFNHGRNGAA
jgi:hypothetical protein